MHPEEDQQSNKSITRQRMDWTCSKTNQACSKFRAGFWTKPSLSGPCCTTSSKLLPRMLYTTTWLQRNHAYLKKGCQKLLQ